MDCFFPGLNPPTEKVKKGDCPLFICSSPFYLLLHSPPVGEFHKDTVIGLSIFSALLPQEIVVDTKEEHGSWFQDPAHKKASVNFFIKVVVVNNRPQRECPGNLVCCSLANNIVIEDLLSSSLLPKCLFAEVHGHLQSFIGFEVEIQPISIAPPEIGIIWVIKNAVAGTEVNPERKPAD